MGSKTAYCDSSLQHGSVKSHQFLPVFLTYLRDPAMLFFQLGDMGRPFYGEDWAADAMRRMQDVYAYTADKINRQRTDRDPSDSA